MALQLLRELSKLQVVVVHPPDGEGQSLVDHLRRIGCRVEAQWPIPDEIPLSCDVLMIAIEQEYRESIKALLKDTSGIPPTVIAIVSYEDPSTLQLLFEIGALAVVERPVRPFGVLTNLIIARSLWVERAEREKRIRKLERRLNGMQRIERAKAILCANQRLTEEEAYQSIRRQAMSKRVSMDEIATAILNANELLTARPKSV